MIRIPPWHLRRMRAISPALLSEVVRIRTLDERAQVVETVSVPAAVESTPAPDDVLGGGEVPVDTGIWRIFVRTPDLPAETDGGARVEVPPGSDEWVPVRDVSPAFADASLLICRWTPG